MRRENKPVIGRVSLALLAAVTVLAALSLVAPVSGDNNTVDCLTGGPAIPVERFRTPAGQGTVELWSPNLRPADTLGQPLPASRDSTEYTSDPDELPGAGGLEIFHDLDIQKDGATSYLYMAFNSGFQIWDITGTRATNPVLRSTRNGWFGDFHFFPDPPTEYYFPIWDIDAIDPVAAPGDTLIALSGDGSVGPTIWDASNKNGPFQLYQDTGKPGIQVAAANIEGRTYGFFAVNNGVQVYDMTRAREIGPCFENTNVAATLCGGDSNPVWRGRLEPWPWTRTKYLDVLEVEISGETRVFVASTDGFHSTPLGVDLREITDVTTLPPTSVGLISGLNTISYGVDLFEYEDRSYLAVVNLDDLEVHDVTACLTGTPGCTLSNPKVDLPTKPEFINFVHFTESNGRPFLYKSFQTLCSSPASSSQPPPEILLELSGLATGEPAVEIQGEQYIDSSSPPKKIQYWSSYYDQANGGFSFFSPHGGRFHGDYFYRGAQTLFDIHQWIEPSAQIAATSDDRWLSSASPDIPEWISLSGACDGSISANWQWVASNAPGTPGADPDPIVELLAGNQARVRANPCSADTYPSSTCPMRSILVSATANCGGLATSSNELSLLLEDPRPFFDSFDILEAPRELGPPPVYVVGGGVSFQTLANGSPGISGKPTTSFEWVVERVGGDEPPLTCTGSGASTGLVCGEAGLSWDTTGVDPDPTVIFMDGFESEDVSAWGGPLRGARGTFDVELTISNERGTFQKTTQVVLLD